MNSRYNHNLLADWAPCAEANANTFISTVAIDFMSFCAII